MDIDQAENAWYAAAAEDDKGVAEDDNGVAEIPVAEGYEEVKEEPQELKEMRRIQENVLGAISAHRELWESENPGQNFDAVRPLTRGRSRLNEEERRRLEIERLDSQLRGRRWQERGPRDGSVQFWRGQAFRKGEYGGQRRFSTRGGKNKEFFYQKWKRSEGHIDG